MIRVTSCRVLDTHLTADEILKTVFLNELIEAICGCKIVREFMRKILKKCQFVRLTCVFYYIRTLKN